MIYFLMQQLATEISKGNDEIDDTEPRSINECRQRNDQPKWKEKIQVELNSLEKRGVFGLIVQTPKEYKPGRF